MKTKTNLHSIVLDPSSNHYLKNKLFDLSNSKLNRDNSLLPFHRLAEKLQNQGVFINTVDFLFENELDQNIHHYFSLGVMSNINELNKRKDINLKGFLIMEPPVVSPELYNALPELTSRFEKVYIHNTEGDGYSLDRVDKSKLNRLYWPQPCFGVIEKNWANTDRLNRIVVINGNHRPKSIEGELYSKRIEAMAGLVKLNAVDLYGRGWAKWWLRSSFWLPYWMNRGRLMSIYKGECSSKLDILSQYRFCLCFENMSMKGYVTEKIFDCLYAGTIPLYWGAPDIDSLIPAEVYIDVRKFESWEDMWGHVRNMSKAEVKLMREAGKAFMRSKKFSKYYNFLQEIIT